MDVILTMAGQRQMIMAKATKNIQSMLPDEAVMSKIYFIRGQKVMLDVDLADMYQVETKQLKRQVRRNIDRFPPDFMFELTMEENQKLRSQFGTLEQGQFSKYLPLHLLNKGINAIRNTQK
jgi:hypothetical protein